MIRLTVESKLKPAQVIDRAVAYFGEEGLGLQITQREDCCASFVGGGGHVAISAAGEDKTTVELETREWDWQVRQFITKIT